MAVEKEREKQRKSRLHDTERCLCIWADAMHEVWLWQSACDIVGASNRENSLVHMNTIASGTHTHTHSTVVLKSHTKNDSREFDSGVLLAYMHALCSAILHARLSDCNACNLICTAFRMGNTGERMSCLDGRTPAHIIIHFQLSTLNEMLREKSAHGTQPPTMVLALTTK